MPGTVQARQGVFKHLFGMANLFARNSTASGKLTASAYIILGLVYVVLSLADFSLQLLHLVILGARLAYGAGKVGFSALELDFGVHSIERDQRRMGIDMVGVVTTDHRHGAADLRGHLNDVAVHIGIVGRFG